MFVIINATVGLIRDTGPVVRFEDVISLVTLVPWVTMLPVVVALWLQRTGLPSPG